MQIPAERSDSVGKALKLGIEGLLDRASLRTLFPLLSAGSTCPAMAENLLTGMLN